MDLECSHCHALHWKAEQLSNSTRNNVKFGMCCLQGKIVLAKLERPPPELRNFLRSDDPPSKQFRNNIQRYNNALAMTSLGCKVDDTVNRGGGPYVFKVQGRLTHRGTHRCCQQHYSSRLFQMSRKYCGFPDFNNLPNHQL